MPRVSKDLSGAACVVMLHYVPQIGSQSVQQGGMMDSLWLAAEKQRYAADVHH